MASDDLEVTSLFMYFYSVGDVNPYRGVQYATILRGAPLLNCSIILYVKVQRNQRGETQESQSRSVVAVVAAVNITNYYICCFALHIKNRDCWKCITQSIRKTNQKPSRFKFKLNLSFEWAGNYTFSTVSVFNVQRYELQNYDLEHAKCLSSSTYFCLGLQQQQQQQL